MSSSAIRIRNRGAAKASLLSSWSRTTWLGVLAEALDALAELLAALHVDLLHAVLAGGDALGRRGRRDLAGLLVVERDVGDEVALHRERAQRRDGRDGVLLPVNVLIRVVQRSRGKPLTSALHEPRARLAVPAHRQVGRLGGLQPVDDVEDDLALVDLDGEVLQLPASLSPRHTRNLPS